MEGFSLTEIDFQIVFNVQVEIEEESALDENDDDGDDGSNSEENEAEDNYNEMD